ncbi:hypothetical protein HID58_012373 [Brassica napus]|uniref:F-box/kelch-repeat protein n=2 Tax=Brassica TaxID=3705 RepID=A0ABQ8E3J0_BRANA|nr:hypothetical protein HID58_012373 [Brassica napus]
MVHISIFSSESGQTLQSPPAIAGSSSSLLSDVSTVIHLYVVGGGGGTEESEVFDLKSQTWNPLPSLSEDNDYPEVQLRRGELLATTSNHKKYVFDPKQGTWKEHPGFSYTRNGPCVKGLKDVCTKPHVNHHTTILLANHGCGSILVLWDELHSLEFQWPGKCGNMSAKTRELVCGDQVEEVLLRITVRDLGEVVSLNAVLTVPRSFKLLSCITL